MTNLFKFFLIWATFSILLLSAGLFKSTMDLGETQQELLTVVEASAVLSDQLDKTSKVLVETESKLEKVNADIQLITEERNALQDKNDEIRKQMNMKDTEIEKLKASTEAKKPVQVSRSTSSDKVERTLTMTATAYTAYCNGCSGVTRTGINLRKDPNLKVIAVDPNVIPLGSKVYVEGYGYAIAGDTGGAIKGSKIDVFIPKQSDAMKFGRKQVTVKILSEG